MKFSCEYIDISGKIRKDVIEASNQKEMYQRLINEKKTPITIKKIKERDKGTKRNLVNEIKTKLKIPIRLKGKTLVLLFYNLQLMLKSGLPLEKALEITSTQLKKEIGVDVLDDVLKSVKKGSSLSSALEETNVFPKLVVPVIRAGEESGKLYDSFNYLSSYYEKQDRVRKKVKSALTYPALLLIGVVVALYFVSTKVLPTILDTVMEGGGEIGMTTKIVVGVSDVMLALGPLVFVIVFGIPGATMFILKKYYREWLDATMLKIPVIGDIVKGNNAVQFVTTMFILISSGVTINKALEISRDVVTNSVFEKEIDEMRKGVLKGESLSANLNSENFGDVVTNIITIGEESGRMAEPLQKASDYLNENIEDRTKKLTDLLVPFTILIVAVMVAVLVIGTLVPMMSSYSQ